MMMITATLANAAKRWCCCGVFLGKGEAQDLPDNGDEDGTVTVSCEERRWHSKDVGR